MKILFIFDWDDTLFPSTYYKKNIINDIFNEKIKKTLLEYDIFLASFIKYIKNVGELIIITNAQLNWIIKSLNYLPQTKFLLRDVKKISAQDNIDNLFIPVNNWKKIIYLKYNAYFNNFDHIFNIGDSDYEHNALKYLISNKKIKCYTASYKFLNNPSMMQLMAQLYNFKEHVKKKIRK